MTKIKTPVLFLIFNRPDTTRRVFQKIREAKPSRLYIACDGPRAHNKHDIKKIKRVKKITTNIDWPCKVKTLFRDKNLGCKKAVSQSITWFFNKEKQGIILEDDCVPSKSFFLYCEKFLNVFYKNKKIWSISGYNHFQNGNKNFFFFSRTPGVWGWATWKDRWKKYKTNPKIVKIKNFHSYGFIFTSFWNNIFKNINCKSNSWDYQFVYLIMKNQGYSIRPNLSLIKNIGFGNDATHTKEKFQSANANEYDIASSNLIGLNKSSLLDRQLFFKRFFSTNKKIFFGYIKYSLIFIFEKLNFFKLYKQIKDK